jgi:hypothetical protein
MDEMLAGQIGEGTLVERLKFTRAHGQTATPAPPTPLQVPVRLRRLDLAFNGFRIAVVSDIHLGPPTVARTPSGSSG